MRIDVSAWAIRNPIPPIVLFLVLGVLGVVAFRGLPITLFPNIDIPIAMVTVTQAGAAPAELEKQVTRRIEDAVAGIAGVKHVISKVTDGQSLTTIEFRIETRIDRAVSDVKDAIARIRSDLPRAIDEPIVQRLDVAGLPIRVYAADSPARSIEELSWFVDDVVIRRLQALRGVGSVERIGGATREIRVLLDPARLAALGVTAADVNRQLRATRVDLAGGRVELGGQEQAVRTLAAASHIAQLEETKLVIGGGRTLRLADVASIEDGIAEPRSFARLDGRPVVAFAISRARGASDATVTDLVDRELEAIRGANPGTGFAAIDGTVRYTLGNYRSAMRALVEGSVLAVLVVFAFLRDLRATIISSVALPLAAIPAFWAMSALGFSLNLVSLLAITLVTGILVDDAIVEVENIVRHIRMGKSPYRAALEAADEIGLAVIAITLTIVAVFAPVSFMGGIPGQYFMQFGLTVAAAVLFSLLVARLLTPLLAAYFMRPDARPEAEGRMTAAYARILGWSVRRRYAAVAVGIALFAASIAGTRLLPSGFLPPEDKARSIFAIELPPGARLADTEAMSDRILARLRALPEVASVFVDGGRVLGSGQEVRKASIVINFVPKDQRARSQAVLEQAVGAILADVPDIRFWIVKDNGQRALTLLVVGPDPRAVEDAARALYAEMRRLPLLANATSTIPLDRPELRVVPRGELAAALGVSTDAISETVRIATIGDAGGNLARFDAGDRLVPIRVQLEESARGDTRLVDTLRLPARDGTTVPLATVASFELGRGITSIDRYDRARRIALEADLRGTDALGAAIASVRDSEAARALPPGVELRQSGDAEVMAEVFAGFAFAMGAGLLMVYGVMVLLFRGFLQPLTILFSLPLSIGGVILGLLLTGNAISMPVVIGILMLMGIVTKNAILLVDFAVEAVARGMPRDEAIVEAGRKRARPIVMTTIAMIAGMVPAALALGDGGEFRAPMAIAVIGGLAVSTMLSLLFVPAAFCVVDDIEGALARRLRPLAGPTDEPPPALDAGGPRKA
ncbi:MAG: efflux RND transporter permease subunit [Alphaproteobacteria bacterium]|nr:efflux RND transporter permease subunit [Alphaproteobacteria bacterium]